MARKKHYRLRYVSFLTAPSPMYQLCMGHSLTLYIKSFNISSCIAFNYLEIYIHYFAIYSFTIYFELLFQMHFIIIGFHQRCTCKRSPGVTGKDAKNSTTEAEDNSLRLASHECYFILIGRYASP